MVFGLSITISILAASWRAGGGVAMFLLRHRAVGGILRRVVVLKGKGIMMMVEIEKQLKRSGSVKEEVWQVQSRSEFWEGTQIETSTCQALRKLQGKGEVL
jgi:hypothetical protein